MKKIVSVLGATGSVGKSTCSLIYKHLDLFEVFLLTADKNYLYLFECIQKIKPKYVFMMDKFANLELKKLVNTLPNDFSVVVLDEKDLVIEMLKIHTHNVVISITGIAALEYLIAGIESGSCMMVANKESLICGGDFVLSLVEKFKAKIIPVDSEHNSIYQIIHNNTNTNIEKDIEKITITCSGGPFLNYELNELKIVTKEMAIKHPKWSMGNKISVDSATIVNKALELIEASVLFGLNEKFIEVVVHPQSIIHGGVMFKDGSFFAVMFESDMSIPISYALFYPERKMSDNRFFSLLNVKEMNFYKLNEVQNKPIQMVRNILNDKYKNILTCVFNACNEIAVDLFLNDRLKFLQIYDVLDYGLECFSSKYLDKYYKIECFENIMEIDEVARNIVTKYCEGL
jgi:1-deoxy-D-xylulose-5-phosphate reductoisomerase